MINEKIELFQNRSFGERINVVFAFIKQNGKPLAKNLAYLVPVYLIVAILMGTYLGSFYTGIMSGYGMPYSTPDISTTGGIFLVFFISMILIYAASFIGALYVIAYVSEYQESELGQIDNSRVWSRVKRSFWGSIGGGILVGIAVVIGLMLCVIPGIWVAVSLMLFIPAYIANKNKEIPLSPTDSIGESFDLVKQDWFGSFGYMFVVGLISSVFIGILGFPMQIIQSSMALVHSGSIFITVIYIIACSLYYVGMLFFSAINNVAYAVLYYDLKERREGLSLQKKIDNIGQHRQDL